MAPAVAALLQRVPIAHIHGGETSQGAVDEAVRHSVSKMASIHFPAAAPYAQRLIQMGEPPERVFTYGAPALDGLYNRQLMTRSELASFLQLDLGNPVALVTYHPVTLELDDCDEPDPKSAGRDRTSRHCGGIHARQRRRHGQPHQRGHRSVCACRAAAVPPLRPPGFGGVLQLPSPSRRDGRQFVERTRGGAFLSTARREYRQSAAGADTRQERHRCRLPCRCDRRGNRAGAVAGVSPLARGHGRIPTMSVAMERPRCGSKRS